MSRPKVTKITITTELDGKIETIEVDSSECSAIFFDDFSVDKMLSNFYKNSNGHKLKYKKAKNAFGKKTADKLFNTVQKKSDDSEIKITKKMVNDVWKAKDDDGESKAYLVKKPFCIFE